MEGKGAGGAGGIANPKKVGVRGEAAEMEGKGAGGEGDIANPKKVGVSGDSVKAKDVAAGSAEGMMKAPGGEGVIPRAVFERNPQAYFAGQRSAAKEGKK